jgi:ammonium transporter, Amt family
VINGSDTAWLMTATVLVLLMTLPALALFYGGLVQAKNILSVLVQCCAVACLASVLWFALGYSLAYSGTGDLLGNLKALFLQNGDRRSLHAGANIPESVFVMFQMTFAIITPALIIGAYVERIRFDAVLVISALWLLIVYVPVTHWVWGGGWLATLGTIDFAGGIVVHTTAGVSALVAAILIGPRTGFPHTLVPPHSPGLTMAGAGMLWVGWFGFNGGSALAADGSAALAVLATQLSASAAALAWMILEWTRIEKPTSVGLVTGCVAGLATITPAAGYVGPMGAIAIGVAGGAVCFFATNFVKKRLAIDDTLDVFAVHGVGGILGTVLAAVFALPALGGIGYAAGMSLGSQFGAQVAGVAAAGFWSALATFAIVKLLGAVMAIRVSEEEEYDGLDLATHGERAYDHS